MSKGITKREDNYSQWYNDIVQKAQLAENSAVRGSMVIKPYGYAIWENMRDQLDRMFKATGHVNAYFPLFIPKSFFNKEASHVDGFAKECAVITHYRLKNDEKTGKIVVDPNAKLEEELIVRPTSETIIWDSYKRWIHSYRDLPILINQWANVVRWEMRTRLFLRTSEFLWQEGHTAHATKEEAMEEARKMITVYRQFAEDYMAMPVLVGRKTDNERFAGAEETYTIEAMMQDGKALQSGTSHFLAQNFAKAFDVKFANEKGDLEYVWASSWGVSTRLIGALIMAHSDDNGLVLPPKLAPLKVVIVPVYRKQEDLKTINTYVAKIVDELINAGITVKYDNDDKFKPGYKFAEYELKGIPIRLTLGMRDIENGQIELVRRDTQEKSFVALNEVVNLIPKLLEDIQNSIFNKAKYFRDTHTYTTDNWDDFQAIIKKGGFVRAHWDGTLETELKIKEKTKATIRLIPDDDNLEGGKCILTGKPSKQRVIFAKAY